DAQDISGNWQGTVKAGPQELRVIVRIAPGNGGGWKATLSSIDQSPDWGASLPADTFTFERPAVKFKLDSIRGSYDGKLSADGSTIAGTWTQGLAQPLDFRRPTPETAWQDPSPHAVQFVTVDKDVKLEVLDWGGSGRPMVLLTGLGNTAHVYDKFALKLTGAYHVYGITRRGFGASSVPDSGYTADRLGDDVLAVLDSLKLNRPVLVGHSVAGEELSSVGSRYPKRVAGLVYLEAGYAYAFSASGSAPPAPFTTAMPTVTQAIIAGGQPYTKVPVPILAIFAAPHDLGPLAPSDPKERAAKEAADEAAVGAQAKAFQTGIPSARVVRLPHANHYVFLSNEADVLREMNTFVSSVP
ncbi:MAG TPA: alpha/beta hydrolase, partial [Bryobacteraceae bacterium]|nr:alpha/beta hydrolase [Bryobacteraceae bacterium]